MLQAHVCGDASAVVSEEAQPKLLVVNHMASLCFHTPLHRVLYRHKGWKKSGMRDVQTSRGILAASPLQLLVCELYKGKASGGTIGQPFDVHAFHLQLFPFGAWFPTSSRSRTMPKDVQRKLGKILGRNRTHSGSFSFMFIEFYWVYCIEFKSPAVIPPGHTLQSDQWPCLHWYFFAGRQQRQWWPRPVDHSTWKVTCREAMTPFLDCQLTITRAGQRMSKAQSWDSFRLQRIQLSV